MKNRLVTAIFLYACATAHGLVYADSLTQLNQKLNSLIHNYRNDHTLLNAAYYQQYVTAFSAYKQAVTQEQQDGTQDSNLANFVTWQTTYQKWQDTFKKIVDQQSGSVSGNSTSAQSGPQSSTSSTSSTSTSSGTAYVKEVGITLFDIIQNPQVQNAQQKNYTSLAGVIDKVEEYVQKELGAQITKFSGAVSTGINGKPEDFSAAVQAALSSFNTAVFGSSGGGGILFVAQEIYQQLLFGASRADNTQASNGSGSTASFVAGDYPSAVGVYDPFGNLLFENIRTTLNEAYQELCAVVRLLTLQIVLPTVAANTQNSLSYYRQQEEEAAHNQITDQSSWWQSVEKEGEGMVTALAPSLIQTYSPVVTKAAQDAMQDKVFKETEVVAV